MDLHHERNEYLKGSLIEANLPAEPFDLFRLWMAEALKTNISDANAMVLSTSKENKPSSRIVLLKALDDRGFVFYTNYESRKGIELKMNPYAALNFYWFDLEKQVRVEGFVERTTASESDEYFYSRPQQSQISAIVSDQSQEIESREELEKKRKAFIQSSQKIVRPSSWGGYRLIPESMEFWQGRESRLHDRIQYNIQDGKWTYRRLSP